ncbi:HMA domain-containing protein [Heracleum sosnowskyi]|uniref:HMA domain-containing protein n=1 Tax=Heracleum sosnowskyi TaxID=360622 RepID=A0AAD8M0T2_9APIA|nr:HMA domain-containing protein [Heracleum sosnowskyi]
MEQPDDGEETFVLKTNIHSRACEKQMEESILKHFQGVRRISIHPTEIGKFTISGTIDPRKLMKFLLKKGITSEHVLEPRINRRDLTNVPRSKSPAENIIDDEVVVRLEALAKLGNRFKTVELKRDKMKLIYKEDEKVQHLDGKNGSCSTARNLHDNGRHTKYKHGMNEDCGLRGNNESCCSRNEGMYTEYCHDCYSTNCGCKAPRESIPVGIPCPPPAYNPVEPSAPPLYSDDDPTGCFMFFLFCFLFLLVQAAL